MPILLRFKWIEGQEVGSSETVKKIVMLAIVVSLAAGCAPLHPSGCHKTTATGSCSSGRWDDQDEWGVKARAIRAAINAKLDQPQNWKGKKCRLHSCLRLRIFTPIQKTRITDRTAGKKLEPISGYSARTTVL